jgi:hypothetical protein
MRARGDAWARAPSGVLRRALLGPSCVHACPGTHACCAPPRPLRYPTRRRIHSLSTSDKVISRSENLSPPRHRPVCVLAVVSSTTADLVPGHSLHHQPRHDAVTRPRRGARATASHVRGRPRRSPGCARRRPSAGLPRAGVQGGRQGHAGDGFSGSSDTSSRKGEVTRHLGGGGRGSQGP